MARPSPAPGGLSPSEARMEVRWGVICPPRRGLMHRFFRLVSCAVALCAGAPAFATEPAFPAPAPGPARFDIPGFAAHLEAELTAAHELIERHGKRVETLRGQELVTGLQELKSSLPMLVRVD